MKKLFSIIKKSKVQSFRIVQLTQKLKVESLVYLSENHVSTDILCYESIACIFEECIILSEASFRFNTSHT